MAALRAVPLTLVYTQLIPRYQPPVALARGREATDARAPSARGRGGGELATALTTCQ